MYCISTILTFFLAHDHAFNKTGVLHHNISVGNILIVEEKGILIDWDLSKRVKKEPSNCDKVRQPTQMVSTVLFTHYVLDTNVHIGDLAIHACFSCHEQ
jgi:RIO-like serine/threonine protein kinase